MTEQTGFPEPSTTPETFDPPAYVSLEDVGSAAAPPSDPVPSQDPLPADAPAPESDNAPDAAAEPAPEPAPAGPPAEAPEAPAAEEIPPAYVPEGQPSWLTDLIHWFDDRLRKLGG